MFSTSRFHSPAARRLFWGKSQRQYNGITTGFVFVNELGEPMHPATLSEWMIRFCARHNLIKLTSKDLRHLHATILGKSKIPIKNASSRMGHAKVSTTLDIYSHDFQDSDELIANKLDELVKLY